VNICRRASILVTVVSLLGLVACGGDDGGGSAAEESPAPDEPSGTLVLSYALGPENFDPHQGPDYELVYQAPVIDRLITQNPDRSLGPELATEWSFADDGSYLDMTLQEGVEFHDGEPFDADAAVANLDRALTLETSTVAQYLVAVESVEATDEYSIRLNLDGPAANLPSVLATNAGAMISPASFDNPDVNIEPVGTGPYELTSLTLGDRAVYERVEGDYYDPEAGLVQTLEIVGIGDGEARLNAVQAQQIDGAFLTPDQFEDALGIAESSGGELEFNRFNNPGFTAVIFNRNWPEFQDARVRQALNYAIDREALIDAFLAGEALPTWQVFAEGKLGHDPELEGYYEFDPDRARELLAEAGFPDGFTLDEPVLYTDQIVGQGEAIQQMLADVGVNIELQRVESGNTQEVFSETQPPAAIEFRTAHMDAADEMDSYMDPQTNLGEPNPELEELIEQGRDQALSIEERDAIYQQINQIITVDDAWQIPVAYFNLGFLNGSDVVGLEADALPFTDQGTYTSRYVYLED
jgi:ABC-type transport system substrate-binding protein